MTYTGVVAASAGTKVKLATLSGASTTYDFTSIDQTYTDLEIVVHGGGSTANEWDFVVAQFNGDTGTNYRYQYSQFGSSAYSGSGSVSASSVQVGVHSGITSSVRLGTSHIYIPKYRDATHYRNVISEGYYFAAALANNGVFQFAGQWANTSAAISRVNLSLTSAGTFNAASSAILYGIT
jgi:hypothetical protein